MFKMKTYSLSSLPFMLSLSSKTLDNR